MSSEFNIGRKNKNNSSDFPNPFARVTDTTCRECHHKIKREKLVEELQVCPECGFHMPMHPYDRIATLVDEGSFTEFSQELTSLNPISISGYEEKLTQARGKAGLNDAVVTGIGSIDGRQTVLGVMSFQFMGGSMGSVVGEKITRAILKGADEGLPVTLVTASGGARMQEGIFSLMQMAKTSNAAALLDGLGIPLFIVLTHPTTGGVTASFAMLGDVSIAEPGALIGFAGQRVIEGTLKEKLPEGFQKSEFQLKKGFVDMIVPRAEMRKTLSFLLKTHESESKGWMSR
ncbi:MAG: acetyl-CoA carboxylase, carboxyltransferase subunit beta [Spirochaetes bacterium]|nr:MAG: acetyl-CoA carboxylase, carboxyltransferase subunit beta [Spirochaetota bacterium]RKX85202.1 MAG: acetyl-CoA carboxylase, carboxyltransferase subunit beta [Spirochaetota bacterium]